ncbi:MAG: rod-binding protein [Catonella sp.]|nr:rod-binding protein [Catonella sp.]MDY6356933.1 rod-binding protein [Catonella sp.]
MDISSLESLYGGYSSITSQYLQDSLSTSLTNKVNSANETNDDAELMQACKSFEAYFLEQILEEAEKTATLPGVEDEDSEGEYVNMFKDTFRSNMAGIISGNTDLGLAKMLYESMKNQVSTVESMNDINN